jgi:hypothetical protein
MFRNVCKACWSKTNQKYRINNSEKIKAYQGTDKYKEIKKKSRVKNKEHEKEYSKKYYGENKDKLYESSKERCKKWREKNKEHLHNYFKRYYQLNYVYKPQKAKDTPEQTREKERLYRLENKERLNEYGRRHYHENKEYICRRSKEYWAKNKEKKRILKHQRLAKIKNLPANFNENDWVKCKECFKNKCAYCGNEEKLVQDHFVPVCRGGEYTINNIIPCCSYCNSSKSARGFFEWYPQQSFYSKIREKKILKYLHYDMFNNQMQQLALY